MKVLVTGAGGNLGRVVVPALAEAGHTLRQLDFRPVDSAHDLLEGDVRNPDDLVRAVAVVAELFQVAAGAVGSGCGAVVRVCAGGLCVGMLQPALISQKS